MPPFAVVLPIALAFLAATPAEAQSVRRVLSDFGFIGAWSADCGMPPASGNTRRTARSGRSGLVTFEEDLGPDYEPNKYVVLSALRVARDAVALRVELNGERVQDLTVVKDGRRVRTMENVGADGKAVVKDGRLVANNRETPWLNKCR
jgi:hypothetical protein